MKKLKVIVSTLVLSLSIYVGYNLFIKMHHKEKAERSIENIPEFSLKTLDTKDFTKINVKSKIPAVFIYFSTECDYCQHEAKNISENLDKFKDIQLIFVSTEAIETIKKFAASYNLLNQPNIIFLNDNTYSFTNRFDANHIPYILIYNSKQELLKKHKGQLNAEAILAVLK